jgi:hypothetical protein
MLSLSKSVFQRADAVDLDANAVTGLQVTGWIQTHAYAGGRACCNDVARVKRDAARAGFYKCGQIKDQVLRLALLP